MEEEMMMMLEEDNNSCSSFTAYEIDLDYEFDAARFFDFTRPESLLEERAAQVWFHSAGTYPPSPFVARLVAGAEIMKDNVNISPKSKGVDNMKLSWSNSDVEVGHDDSAMDINHKDNRGQVKGTNSNLQIGSRQTVENPSEKLASGLIFYNHIVNDMKPKCQTKKSTKPSFSRTSTLMKPTASQLAKQNRPLHAIYSRSNTSALEKTDKSSNTTSVIENHAAKRQKLESGLLRKVVGAFQQQQTNFIHKAPKQDVFRHVNSTHAKPRITIPREPDLETANRAQRTRPKNSKEAENVISTIRRFKALPLNRKILEAPLLVSKRSTPCLPDFQEFNLKTSERATQHGLVVPKSTIPCDSSDKAFHKYATNLTTECRPREPARPSLVNSSKIEDCESSHSFKALPLNKKILTSKGDIGVFRNNKKESTVPMEFNFQTERRHHNHPPIELFNKLSLASEAQQLPNPESKFQRSTTISVKGSKENRWGGFRQENEKLQIKQPAKSKLSVLGEKTAF